MPKNLKQHANRHALIAVFLFAILIGTVSFAYIDASHGVQDQQALHQDQAQLVQFSAMLPQMLAPMDDFMVTENPADKAREAKAMVAFQRAYSEVSALPSISVDQTRRLKQVFDLMQGVRSIAADVLEGQATHRPDRGLIAHDLVATAQARLGRIAGELDATQQQRGQAIQQRMTLMAGVNLGITVLLLLIVVMLMRGIAKGMIHTLTDIAADVGAASGAMLQAAEKQAQAAETQGLSLAGITRDLEQMSGVSRKIAATAGSLDRIAEAMARTAEQAGRGLDASVAQWQDMRDTVDAIAARGRDAREKAARMMESLTSVQEIADETHLLALNASIESAASGEGKRFAVVAAEVRRLAERVREFSEEIEGVVDEVDAAASASIAVTEGGLAGVEQGLESGQGARDALVQVQAMSDKSSQAVRAIAQATSRQDKTGQAYLEGMQQMAELLHDSAEQLQDSRDISERLMGVAEDLKRLL